MDGARQGWSVGSQTKNKKSPDTDTRTFADRVQEGSSAKLKTEPICVSTVRVWTGGGASEATR